LQFLIIVQVLLSTLSVIKLLLSLIF
jgi:hypothetical protein